MLYSHVVKPGSHVDLAKIRTDDTAGLEKEEALAKTEILGRRLEDLQEMLYAAGTHALLIVFQGMDTSGKDGAIRRILGATNVQSTQVVPFKQPTALEQSHDFLWRVHPHVPALGGVTLFNRSHYEDVLVVRVHKLAPRSVWKKRYEQINAFERLLSDSNTLIVKFYLHISKHEQKQRLLDREKEAIKAWKLSAGDWKERELWPDYREAYEDAISKCSTDDAPWHVVPADHKWFRDLAILEAIVDLLKPLESDWKKALDAIGSERKQELLSWREQNPKNS